ncbi:MAG: metalloregulator ArsR/SmtB family transcription factor [Parvularculaceae bacterium]|nr:metalloregulator ArsR/SmtB family transcription factor [Parvularculaceae bacterium]
MSLDATLNIFKAIGEETRLRVMALLLRGELTVTELTHILGQSQPRVSRHLKILSDAGLVEKYREGSWVFYRAGASPSGGGEAVFDVLRALDGDEDRVVARDREKFQQSREARARLAAQYFQENAGDWEKLRRLHLPEREIEKRMLSVVRGEPAGLFVDLGTGTGRMLELFADVYAQGIGFDLSREMLAVARANLEKAGVAHAQVRLGDLFATPLDSASADVVCVHQVLHFLADPGAAVAEAARLLKPGGRLLISDFAPHDLEFLRERHAHRRLGFSDDEVRSWCRASGLALSGVETLTPAAGEGRELTVKIWVATAPRAVQNLKPRASASR